MVLLMEEYLKEFTRWKEKADDPENIRALSEMEGDDGEIRLRFTAPLEFGTAGLRGVMTAGINAMNVYTVARTTLGLCDYILSGSVESGKTDDIKTLKRRGIVIAYDTRHNSLLFARIAAQAISSRQINVYLMDSPRPTPLLSYAVRELGCIAGINITASHNPKEYNGYKVYWEDGAQIPPAEAEKIAKKIASIDVLSPIPEADQSLITTLGEDFDEKYISEVLKQRIRPARLCGEYAPKVIYTPLSGAGWRIVPETLRRAGLCELVTVESQSMPDANFAGLKNPNPEFSQAFEEGLKTAASHTDADLIIATDPDADRVGIMARAPDGEFVLFSGNQIGALLLEYILHAMQETNTTPSQPYAIKTIVSTELAAAICRSYDVKLYDVLTGFKYIGEVIKANEDQGCEGFVFAFEESNGYLKGSYARDKDAVVATLLLCEAAAYYANRGMTLYQALERMYQKYGHFTEQVDNIYMGGSDGATKIKSVMERLRSVDLYEIAGYPVSFCRDYKLGVVINADGSRNADDLPPSDVLYYRISDKDAVIVRPSGTEPKIKLYCLAHAETAEQAKEKAGSLMEAIRSFAGV